MRVADALGGGSRHLAASAQPPRPAPAIHRPGRYRTAFARPGAAIGAQDETLGPARLWILPNPSGLNAQWTLLRITEAFRELYEAVGD